MSIMNPELFHEISRARINAHQKHGENSIEAIAWNDPRWLPILAEEFGETAHELTDDATGSLRAELIDMASVITAWIDAIDRSRATADVVIQTIEGLVYAAEHHDLTCVDRSHAHLEADYEKHKGGEGNYLVHLVCDDCNSVLGHVDSYEVSVNGKLVYLNLNTTAGGWTIR